MTDFEKKIYARDVMFDSRFRDNKTVDVHMRPKDQEPTDRTAYDVELVDVDSDGWFIFRDMFGNKIIGIYPDKYTELNGLSAKDYGFEEEKGDIDAPGCYLTTACVDYFGKPDDCYELETLRSFRDGFMQTSTEMKEAAKKYYVIAPKIVAKINSLPNKASVYQKMYTDLVQKCINLINKGKNKEAYETYKDYSEALEEKYL